MKETKKRTNWLKRLWRLALAAVGVVLAMNGWISFAARGRIFTPATAPGTEAVALVLGTSKRRSDGSPNAHFENRMEAAAELYRLGKVKRLLVSGDNRSPYYNEPRDMRDALVAKGVPAGAVTCDYAGLRTLDSVLRARDAFGLEHFAIVSDDWHVARAMFIADHHGIRTTGVESRDVSWWFSYKSRLREVGARVLVVLDVFFLHEKPLHGPDGSEENLGAGGGGAPAPRVHKKEGGN